MEVHPAKDVKNLSPYSAVILGSGIRMGNLLSDAMKFVEEHRKALERIPVAYFVLCLTMKDDTEENCRTVEATSTRSASWWSRLTRVSSRGVTDYSKLSFPARTMSRAMKVSEGDFRDWEATRSWARQVHDQLTRT